MESLRVESVERLESAARSRRAGVRSENLVDLYLCRYDRGHTRRAYRTGLASFFGTDHVTIELAQDVTTVDVNQYIRRLEVRGLAPSTICARVSAIRSFYALLIALGLARLNPAARELVRRVAQSDWKTREVRVLTREEARALVDAPDPDSWTGVRDRALLRVLLKCLLRRGEAAALDFEHVRPTGGHWVVDIPRAKGGANQYVKATEDVVAEVARVRERYGWETGPVFRTLARGPHYGGRMTGQGIATIVKRAARRAGLERVTPHVLRHTGCTLALEGGASLLQVKAHARHVLVATTLIYVHQRDRLENSAADFITF